MSAIDQKDMDFSAAGQEHIGLPEGSRKPFHEMLAQLLMATTEESDLELLKWIVGETVIPDNHDEIVRIIDMKKLQVISPWWEDIKMAVLDQKAEAEAQKAEEANKATDADKVAALVAVINKMLKHIPPGLVGEQAVAMGRFFLRFQELSGRAQRAKTIQEIQQVLTELK